jgi:hypothetical protein
LLALAGLLLYVVAGPYLRLRLYAESTMWSLPPPPGVRLVHREVWVFRKCGEVRMMAQYRTDRLWADVQTHYRAAMQPPAWYNHSYPIGIKSTWRFLEYVGDDPPFMGVTIHPQMPPDSLLPNALNRPPLVATDHDYVVELEYIADQRAYRTCYHD